MSPEESDRRAAELDRKILAYTRSKQARPARRHSVLDVEISRYYMANPDVKAMVERAKADPKGSAKAIDRIRRARSGTIMRSAWGGQILSVR